MGGRWRHHFRFLRFMGRSRPRIRQGVGQSDSNRPISSQSSLHEEENCESGQGAQTGRIRREHSHRRRVKKGEKEREKRKAEKEQKKIEREKRKAEKEEKREKREKEKIRKERNRDGAGKGDKKAKERKEKESGEDVFLVMMKEEEKL